jgi:hypothetical protein
MKDFFIIVQRFIIIINNYKKKLNQSSIVHDNFVGKLIKLTCDLIIPVYNEILNYKNPKVLIY